MNEDWIVDYGWVVVHFASKAEALDAAEKAVREGLRTEARVYRMMSVVRAKVATTVEDV